MNDIVNLILIAILMLKCIDRWTMNRGKKKKKTNKSTCTVLITQKNNSHSISNFSHRSFINILQTNISKPANIESTALGACVVSQIAEGLSIKDIKLELEDIYDPDISSAEFYTKDYLSWKDFIHRTISNIKQ